MTNANVHLLIWLCASGVTSGYRVKVHQSQRLEGQLQAGGMLDEFFLVRRLDTWPLRASRTPHDQADSFLQNESFMEAKGLPTDVRQDLWQDNSTKFRRLAEGGFGEAWLATASNMGLVVLKVFYQDVGGSRRYYSYNAAPSKVRLSMREEDDACTDVKALKAAATAMGHPGGSHIAECIESRVFGQYLTKTAKIIQEFAGQPLTVIPQQLGSGPTQTAQMRLNLVRMAIAQILLVLDLMQRAYPRVWIHHDLKPGNVMVTILSADKVHVKVIDWGGIQKAGVGKEACAWSEDWAPPECMTANPCYVADAPGSYDTYATGLIYLSLLLNGVWQGWVTHGNKVTDTVIQRLQTQTSSLGLLAPAEDIALIRGLCKISPKLRLTPLDALNKLHGFAATASWDIRIPTTSSTTTVWTGVHPQQLVGRWKSKTGKRSYLIAADSSYAGKYNLHLFKEGSGRKGGGQFDISNCNQERCSFEASYSSGVWNPMSSKAADFMMSIRLYRPDRGIMKALETAKGGVSHSKIVNPAEFFERVML